MKSLNLFFAVLLFGSLFTFTSCNDEEETTTPVVKKSIVDVVVGDANFSLLEAAVLHAGVAICTYESSYYRICSDGCGL
jgi:hypothetical protein